jgi:hypothetical protein
VTGGAKCSITRSKSGAISPLGPDGLIAILSGTVKNWKIELIFRCVEIGEQVEYLVDHLDMALIRLIDLIDGYDRPKSDLQRLGHHELGLRHGAFGGVDQHDGTIHHIQNTLNLAAEIRVPGRIDNVDARVLPQYGGHFRQDRYSAFPLEIVRVHRPLGDPLVVAERARLPQKNVDHGGFSVIDVGDNSNIAKLHLSRKPSSVFSCLSRHFRA